MPESTPNRCEVQDANIRRHTLLLTYTPAFAFRVPVLSEATDPPSVVTDPVVSNELSERALEAAKAGDLMVLREAFDRGVQPKDVAISALSNGSPETYSCLLQAGLEPDYRLPGYMGTALTGAAIFGKPRLTRLLLERGANPNSPNARFGGPPQMGALACAATCIKNHKASAEIVSMLLEAGAKIDGSGALHEACYKGRLDVVRILIESGANVNERGIRRDGKSPLMLATEQGHEEIVEVLRAHATSEQRVIDK